MTVNPISDLPGESDVPAWTVEELIDVRGDRSLGRPSRRAPLVVAFAAALVGFGFGGHFAGSPDVSRDPVAPIPSDPIAPAADAGPAVDRRLIVTEPQQGASVSGGLLTVRAVAAGPLGRVHVSVVVGSAVLGWANLDIARPGTLSATIRLFPPAFEVGAELRIDGGPRGTPISIARAITLSPSAPIGVWAVERTAGPDAEHLTVVGYAPLSGDGVTVRVVSADGMCLATVDVAAGVDDAAAGSFGGSLVGTGSFRTGLDLRGPDRQRASSVEVRPFADRR